MNQSQDQLLQDTCEAILTVAAQAIDAEPPGSAEAVRVAEAVRGAEGQILGKRFMINATEPNGPLNLCRVSVMNPDVSPIGEVARIEYEHDKQGKFGLQKAYSVQSVRRQDGQLVLLENFLAADENHVREEDFRPIHSETYAQKTVLSTLREWVEHRNWQLRQGRRS